MECGHVVRGAAERAARAIAADPDAFVLPPNAVFMSTVAWNTDVQRAICAVANSPSGGLVVFGIAPNDRGSFRLNPTATPDAAAKLDRTMRLRFPLDFFPPFAMADFARSNEDHTGCWLAVEEVLASEGCGAGVASSEGARPSPTRIACVLAVSPASPCVLLASNATQLFKKRLGNTSHDWSTTSALQQALSDVVTIPLAGCGGVNCSLRKLPRGAWSTQLGGDESSVHDNNAANWYQPARGARHAAEQVQERLAEYGYQLLNGDHDNASLTVGVEDSSRCPYPLLFHPELSDADLCASVAAGVGKAVRDLVPPVDESGVRVDIAELPISWDDLATCDDRVVAFACANDKAFSALIETHAKCTPVSENPGAVDAGALVHPGVPTVPLPLIDCESRGSGLSYIMRGPAWWGSAPPAEPSEAAPPAVEAGDASAPESAVQSCAQALFVFTRARVAVPPATRDAALVKDGIHRVTSDLDEGRWRLPRAVVVTVHLPPRERRVIRLAGGMLSTYALRADCVGPAGGVSSEWSDSTFVAWGAEDIWLRYSSASVATTHSLMSLLNSTRQSVTVLVDLTLPVDVTAVAPLSVAGTGAGDAEASSGEHAALHGAGAGACARPAGREPDGIGLSTPGAAPTQPLSPLGALRQLLGDAGWYEELHLQWLVQPRACVDVVMQVAAAGMPPDRADTALRTLLSRVFSLCADLREPADLRLHLITGTAHAHANVVRQTVDSFRADRRHMLPHLRLYHRSDLTTLLSAAIRPAPPVAGGGESGSDGVAAERKLLALSFLHGNTDALLGREGALLAGGAELSREAGERRVDISRNPEHFRKLRQWLQKAVESWRARELSCVPASFVVAKTSHGCGATVLALRTAADVLTEARVPLASLCLLDHTAEGWVKFGSPLDSTLVIAVVRSFSALGKSALQQVQARFAGDRTGIAVVVLNITSALGERCGADVVLSQRLNDRELDDAIALYAAAFPSRAEAIASVATGIFPLTPASAAVPSGGADDASGGSARSEHALRIASVVQRSLERSLFAVRLAACSRAFVPLQRLLQQLVPPALPATGAGAILSGTLLPSVQFIAAVALLDGYVLDGLPPVVLDALQDKFIQLLRGPGDSASVMGCDWASLFRLKKGRLRTFHSCFPAVLLPVACAAMGAPSPADRLTALVESCIGCLWNICPEAVHVLLVGEFEENFGSRVSRTTQTRVDKLPLLPHALFQVRGVDAAVGVINTCLQFRSTVFGTRHAWAWPYYLLVRSRLHSAQARIEAIAGTGAGAASAGSASARTGNRFLYSARAYNDADAALRMWLLGGSEPHSAVRDTVRDVAPAVADVKVRLEELAAQVAADTFPPARVGALHWLATAAWHATKGRDGEPAWGLSRVPAAKAVIELLLRLRTTRAENQDGVAADAGLAAKVMRWLHRSSHLSAASVAESLSARWLAEVGAPLLPASDELSGAAPVASPTAASLPASSPPEHVGVLRTCLSE